MFAGVGQLGLGSAQCTLAAAQLGLGRVVFALAGVALGQEFLLAHERRRTLLDPRLLGGHLGLGGVDVGLQVPGVEPGQHLPGRDPGADIDLAFDDLATHAKRQVSLHPRLDIAGQGHRSGVFAGHGLLHENPRQGFFFGLLITAPRQQHAHAQTNHQFDSGTSHADSFALYGRTSDDTTVSLEQGSTNTTGAANQAN
ncbi:hypothetical protein D3C76_1086400 [compost metagenome]